MRLLVITLIALLSIACQSVDTPTPIPTLTPTLEPTLTPAPISTPSPTSTLVPTPDIDATIEAVVAVTVAAIPTSVSTPLPTPVPTHTPVPAFTPISTLTPVPTYTPVPMPTLTPTSTLTPVPTFTPVPTLTPVPTPTATPIPTPIPASEPDWDKVQIGVVLQNDADGYLKPLVFSVVDWPAYNVTLFVGLMEYCNTSRIYANEFMVVDGCESSKMPYDAVSTVSVQTRLGVDFWCRQSEEDIGDTSVLWGCWLRD